MVRKGVEPGSSLQVTEGVEPGGFEPVAKGVESVGGTRVVLAEYTGGSHEILHRLQRGF